MSGDRLTDSRDRAAPRSTGRPVFVVGAGTMAPGIAAAFAVAGHPVMLWGRAKDRTARAVAGAREMAGFLVEHGLAADRGSVEVAQRLEQAASAMRRRDEELVRRLKLPATQEQLRGSVPA